MRGGSAAGACQESVEGRTWAHDRLGLLRIGQEITADVHRLALDVAQFVHDLLFLLDQALGQRGEVRCQLRILVLIG